MEETSSNNKKTDEVEYIDEEEIAKGSEKVGKLKRELETCKNEKDEYLKGWQRAKADYVNAERLFADRESGSVDVAKRKLLLEILEIADGFENAFTFSPADSHWVAGIKGLAANLQSILQRYGIEPIDAKGKVFDPNLHEAVEVGDVEIEDDDGKVLEEYQKGYMRNGRVLRPTKVKVGRYQKE
jgi:molecular chaperone GrpE